MDTRALARAVQDELDEDMLLAKVATPLTSAGSGAVIGLLLLTEAGVPVPIPADLLMIALGERVSAGALPLSVALIALQVVALVGTLFLYWLARGPGRRLLDRFGPRIGLTEARLAKADAAVARRGSVAVAVGRSTPGLRTVTVVAAAGTRGGTRTLVALFLGSTLFVQGHFLLGLALGPAARKLFEQSGLLALVLLLALLGAGVVVWFTRRSRRGGATAFAEACCPACLAIGLIGERGKEPVPG